MAKEGKRIGKGRELRNIEIHQPQRLLVASTIHGGYHMDDNGPTIFIELGGCPPLLQLLKSTYMTL
jgi:hypothetical protein